MAATDGTIVALDVGAVRVGVALASTVARIAHPNGALKRDATTISELQKLCRREGAVQIVVGLPRGLSGQETPQTAAVRAFGEELAKALLLPLHWQDEAVTSVQAEAELRARGKPYAKGDIDALAAAYILEDYLHDHL